MQHPLPPDSSNTLDNQIIKLLLEYTTLGVILCDNSEFILETNAFVSDLLKLEKDMILSRKLSDFFAIKDNKTASTSSKLDDLFSNTDVPSFKVVNMDVLKDGRQYTEIETHIYTRIQGGDFYLVCLFDNNSPSQNLTTLLDKYKTFSCYKDEAEETTDCTAIKELIETVKSLSREVNETSSLKRKVEQALESEKKHSEFKTRFVSIASHELRTPLGGILTSASLLEKYNDINNAPQRKKHIDIIKGQVRTLTSILNDFLSFDRLDQPEVRVNLKMFSLSDFFHRFLYSFSEFSQTKGRIKYNHIGKDVLIYQDPELLLKVVSNIVSNGLKYSDEDKNIYITSRANKKNIQIIVQDTGIGIPDTEKEYIWDLFYRCENTSGVQGTGLGLNIALLCCNLMNGQISFKSEENIGTDFTIEFPRE